MFEDYEEVKSLVESKEYRTAQSRIALLKREVEKASRFTLSRQEREVSSYFSELKNNSPEIYSSVKVQENELYERIYEKKKGIRIKIE